MSVRANKCWYLGGDVQKHSYPYLPFGGVGEVVQKLRRDRYPLISEAMAEVRPVG